MLKKKLLDKILPNIKSLYENKEEIYVFDLPQTKINENTQSSLTQNSQISTQEFIDYSQSSHTQNSPILLSQKKPNSATYKKFFKKNMEKILENEEQILKTIWESLKKKALKLLKNVNIIKK